MRTTSQRAKLWTPNFTRLIIWQVITYIALYSITATFSTYVVDYFDASPLEIGAISSVLIISSLLFRPVAGILTDRFGRRLIVTIALVLLVVLNLMLLIPKTLLGLAFLRFLMGIPFSMVTTGNSALRTDIIPEEQRSNGFNLSAIAMMFSGLVAGPNLGFLVLTIANFLILFSLSAALVLIGLFVFRSMRFPDIKTKKVSFSFSGLFEPKVMWITLILGFNFIGWPGILSFGPLYAKEVGLYFSGYLFTAYGVGLLISRPVIRFIEKKESRLYLNAIGVLSTLIGHAVIGFLPTQPGFMLGMIFLGLGYGQCFSVLQKLAYDIVEPERRGRCAATIYINQDIGSTFGRYFLGYFADVLGTYNATYRIASGTTIVPLLILLFIALPDYKRKMGIR